MQPTHGSRSDPKSFWDGANRDEITLQHFNGKYETEIQNKSITEVLSQTIFGRVLEEIEWGQFGGAPDGSTVSVLPQTTGGIKLEISHTDFVFNGTPVTRLVQIDQEGVSSLECHAMFLTKETQGKGIGTRMMAHTIKKCGQEGLKFLTLEAAGSAADRQKSPPGDALLGYYVWPEMGFESALLEEEIALIPASIGNIESLADLMESDEGRSWWRENGSRRPALFSLEPNSRSFRIMQDYMERKGIRIGWV